MAVTPSLVPMVATAVVRAHRGHRLGLLVKTAMLDLLAAAEPQLNGSPPATPRRTRT